MGWNAEFPGFWRNDVTQFGMQRKGIERSWSIFFYKLKTQVDPANMYCLCINCFIEASDHAMVKPPL
jgi:hypothetical protein